MAIEIIVHPGVDSAFIAWRAPFIDQCRGFALVRNKGAPGIDGITVTWAIQR